MGTTFLYFGLTFAFSLVLGIFVWRYALANKTNTAAKCRATAPATVHRETGEDKICLSQSSEQPVVEQEILRQLAEDTSFEMLAELVALFMTDNRSRLDRINQAIADWDFKVMEEECHSLGSSAGTYGAMPLHYLARKIEQRCRLEEFRDALFLAKTLPPMADRTFSELQTASATLLSEAQYCRSGSQHETQLISGAKQ